MAVLAVAGRSFYSIPQLFILVLLVLTSPGVIALISASECPQSCGNVEITYPFGIGIGCYLPGFEIICKEGIPFLAGTQIQVLEILPGEVRVNSTPFVASYCPIPQGRSQPQKNIMLPKDGPFTFLTGSNKVILLGCDVEVSLTYDSGTQAFCSSRCRPLADSIAKGTCNGNGCCEETLSEVSISLQVAIERARSNGIYPLDNKCRHAFIVDDGPCNFSELDGENGLSNISMKLEWAIGEEGCSQAVRSKSYVCGTNSSCVDSKRSSGYLCECDGWLQGNPYLTGSQGCHGHPHLKCQERCGHVTISSPFGIGEGCFHRGFEVTCNNSIPYLADLNVQLLEIMPGEVLINSTSFIAVDCPGMADFKNTTRVQLAQDDPYTISVGSNKFMLVGCDAEGVVADEDSTPKLCRTQCQNGQEIHMDSFSADGFCQSTLPLLQKSFEVTVHNLNKRSSNSCSYGFLAEDGSYKFRQRDLSNFQGAADVRMKLEWAMGEITCDESRQSPFYACGSNTSCIDAPRGSGYLCSCLDGYEGNPYSSLGCLDVDECSTPNKSHCVPEATCQNKLGGYDCICPNGTPAGENACNKPVQIAKVITASMLFAAVTMASISWGYWAYRKRKLIKLRSTYFHRNGGLLLQQHLSLTKAKSCRQTRIFSAEQLRIATNNYPSNRILGHGGHGTVYKGTLKDGTVVAIKKSQVVAQDKLNQFINELVILTQINHRNIVKLLGCCLDTQVPLLVYEFIPNGTLHQNLHDETKFRRMPWKDRLRIATEIAEALSYLHSYASMPIFHRDVKSSNVLLDEKHTAKLADFGISKLIPVDKDQVSTAVLGTFGYLDPAYFSSGKLTEKSDVYSFGVVLLELLTGKKPIICNESQDYSSLVTLFLDQAGSGRLLDVLDDWILKEGAIEEVLAVAETARRCLSSVPEERPLMKEIMREFSLIQKYSAKPKR